MIDNTKIKDAGHGEQLTKEKTREWLSEITAKCEELSSLLRDKMPLYAYSGDDKLAITFPDTLFAVIPVVAVLRQYGVMTAHRIMSLKGTKYTKNYIESFENLMNGAVDKEFLEKILVKVKQVPPMEIMKWAANEMGANKK